MNGLSKIILLSCVVFATSKNVNKRKSSFKISTFKTKSPLIGTAVMKKPVKKKPVMKKPVKKKPNYLARFMTPKLIEYSKNFNDHSNCLEWTCKEWCAFYDPSFKEAYIKAGCVDDGDYCIC